MCDTRVAKASGRMTISYLSDLFSLISPVIVALIDATKAILVCAALFAFFFALYIVGLATWICTGIKNL